MEIITNAENRKELVKALSGHFGQRSEYLGPPSFAYRIGSITVDRDAKVILEDDSMEDEVRRVLFQNDVAEETQETQTEEPEAEIKTLGVSRLMRPPLMSVPICPEQSSVWEHPFPTLPLLVSLSG